MKRFKNTAYSARLGEKIAEEMVSPKIQSVRESKYSGSDLKHLQEGYSDEFYTARNKAYEKYFKKKPYNYEYSGPGSAGMYGDLKLGKYYESEIENFKKNKAEWKKSLDDLGIGMKPEEKDRYLEELFEEQLKLKQEDLDFWKSSQNSKHQNSKALLDETKRNLKDPKFNAYFKSRYLDKNGVLKDSGWIYKEGLKDKLNLTLDIDSL